MYSALIDLPRYDYYILAEFDVVIGANLDQTIEQLQRMGGDAVTAYMHKAPPDWVWTKTADEIYPEVYGSLNPVLILSRRAVSNLYYARLAQSHRWATSRLKQWPYCEAFIASQLKHAKLQVHELAEFGPTEHLSWWPPMEERLVLEQLGGQAFVHPVLAGDAYIRSLARYDTSGGPGTAVQRDKEAWDAEFARLKDLHSRGLQPV